MADKKIKVAIVLEATLGGTRKHVVDILENIDYNNFEVHFIYATKRSDLKFPEQLAHLATLPVVLHELKMGLGYGVLNGVFGCVKSMRNIFRTIQPEVIHLHGAIAGFLGRIASRGITSIQKIIYSPHGGSFHKMEGRFGFIYKILEKYLLTSKQTIIAVSEYEKKDIERKLNRKANINIIPNGISLTSHPVSKRTFSTLLDSLQIPRHQHPFLVLYPAVFLPAKGHLNFLKAILAHGHLDPNVFILLAGDGPLKQEIESLIAANSLLSKHVRMLGFQTDLMPLIDNTDIVILPSLNEAFGYVLVEAFSRRKAVLATRVGGITDIVDDGINGFLYSPEDLGQMINDLNKLPKEQDRLKEMGEQGYKKTKEKFLLTQTIRQIQSHYN